MNYLTDFRDKDKSIMSYLKHASEKLFDICMNQWENELNSDLPR